MRIESKHLFSENVSPFVKSIILKKRAGITLTEQEKRRFEIESIRLNESVVSMVELPKNSDRLSPTQSLKNTFGKKKSFDELGDDEEIDLDEILRGMGYEVEEPEEEIDYLSDEEYKQILKDLGLDG